MPPTTPPVHLVLPVGDGFGWGVVGRGLTLGMLAHREGKGVLLSPVDGTSAEDGGDRLAAVRDPFVRRLLEAHLSPTTVTPERAEPAGEGAALAPAEPPSPIPVPEAVLHAVSGTVLRPVGTPLRSRGPAPTLGYAVFEDVLPTDAAATAEPWFDRLVAPSRWCAERLEEVGFRDVPVVLHGVDTRLFHPGGRDKRQLRDRFVVFSGGKAEMRKGQDLVIRAFAAFSQRHDDALLVASWFNPWAWSLSTLGACPGFADPLAGLGGSGSKAVPFETVARRLLESHGVGPRHSLVLPPLDHGTLAGVYKQSDVGLFPNRCEGASNLVLMEYMACGKPVIASDWAGHREVLTDDNSRPLRRLSPLEVHDAEGRVTGRWAQPDLEEIVEALQWAYDHPDELDALGRRAGEDLSHLTWHRAAAEMDRLLTGRR